MVNRSRTPAGEEPAGGSEQTSFHICRAGEGEPASLAWVVARFTPLLRAQADYRLRGPLRRICDPDDLVDEVWAAMLPRFHDLRAPGGRWTPVLLRFLGTTLLHKVNHLLAREARFALRKAQALDGTVNQSDPLHQVPSTITSVLTQVQRDEAFRMLNEALDQLDGDEREILVLRGIEQHAHAEIAGLLGSTVGAVTMRYHRALERLRSLLPGSILDELPVD